MYKDYWTKLNSREKQSERIRYNKIMHEIEQGGGGGGEPLFLASPAHDITTTDVNLLHNTTDPIIQNSTLEAKLQLIIDAINALP